MRHISRWLPTVVLGLAVATAAAGCGATAPVAAGAPTSATTAPTATTASSALATPSAGTASAQPAPTPPSPATPLRSPVQVTRSGTMAGINQSILIAPDGAWTLTDRRKGTSRQGRLSTGDVARLAALLADPRLGGEAAAKAPPGVCSDGLVSVISASGLVLRDDGCGTGNHPATAAVLGFVATVIPL
jgi:hypothetical protein